jgi:hypothetical protein
MLKRHPWCRSNDECPGNEDSALLLVRTLKMQVSALWGVLDCVSPEGGGQLCGMSWSGSKRTGKLVLLL